MLSCLKQNQKDRTVTYQTRKLHSVQVGALYKKDIIKSLYENGNEHELPILTG